jgi:hypothetical protein
MTGRLSGPIPDPSGATYRNLIYTRNDPFRSYRDGCTRLGVTSLRGYLDGNPGNPGKVAPA